MSLQEIEISKVKETNEGFRKSIDASSEKMMLDVLQITQYTKPVESATREIVSNAVDSQKEKEIAIEILTGRAKVEDYFIQRDEDKYKDSNWDPSYYSLEHLNQEKNKVEIIYEEHLGSGFTDKLIIRDHGVGLGMPRLEGYFSLGLNE